MISSQIRLATPPIISLLRIDLMLHQKYRTAIENQAETVVDGHIINTNSTTIVQSRIASPGGIVQNQ